MKRALGFTLTVLFTLCLASPAAAIFHRVVIEQLFFGTEGAPRAQYLMLRTLDTGQVYVATQSMPTQNPDGSPAGSFGTFTKSFTMHTAPGVAILAGTQEAQDLFCVAMDQIVDGTLLFPDGRVCFGLWDYLDGKGFRPVDCIAYGNYSAATEPYLPPAMTPELGMALVRASETDNNQHDFVLLPPMPQNNPGAVGMIDGVAGDTDGDGGVDGADIEALARLLFNASKRCDLEAASRGADANVDTRLGAADLIAATQHLSPPLGA